jgi:nitrosocyanin
MGLIRRVLPLALALSLIVALGALRALAQAPALPARAAKPPVKEFMLVSVLIGDVKFWLPGVVVVNEGDRVRLKLKNIVPGAENQHGFSIPAFNITELVIRGQDKTIEFTADKAGVFPYICHIHPAHVNGQLVVLPAPKAESPAPAKAPPAARK